MEKTDQTLDRAMEQTPATLCSNVSCEGHLRPRAGSVPNEVGYNCLRESHVADLESVPQGKDSSLKYQTKLDEYVSTIWNTRYLIEFTKCCCNYSFFLPMYKNYTLAEVYRNVILGTEIHNIQLYVEDNMNSRLYIHRDSDMTLQMFIRQNTGMFVPIYPLPMKVVYRIYYDDGSEHSHP